MDLAQKRLQWLGEFVLTYSKSPFLFLALIVIAILKTGVVDMSSNPDQIREENTSFPNPSGILTPISYGMRIVNWTLTPETRFDNLLIGIGLLIAAFIALFLIVSRVEDPVERSFLAIVVVLGSITTVLLGNLGRNDIFLLLGSVLAATSIPMHRSLGGGVVTARVCIRFLLGVLLMIMGNPEQTVVALILLLALTAAMNFRSVLPYALLGLSVSIVVYFLLASWASSYGAPNRFSLVDNFWSQSVQNFSLNFWLVIYSGFGVAWVILAYLFLSSRLLDLLILIATLVAMPIAVTALTVDQTRVWVGITALVSVVVVRWVSRSVASQYRKEIIGSLLVIALLLPSLEVTYLGEVRSPHDYVYFLITSGSIG